MLKGLTLAAALVAGGLGMASAAQAAPVGPALSGVAADGLITQVAQGCGRGFHRGPYGGCRPNFGRRAFGGPRFYGRRCFVRPTPFGPRRVCR